MSTKRIILEYISRHTPHNVIKRGERLYQQNAVYFIGYDSKKDTYRFKVKGSRFYNVEIKNLNKKKLDSKCNCPYNWSDVCKHQIAALFYLMNNETGQLQNKKILNLRENCVAHFQFSRDGTCHFALSLVSMRCEGEGERWMDVHYIAAPPMFVHSLRRQRIKPSCEIKCIM